MLQFWKYFRRKNGDFELKNTTMYANHDHNMGFQKIAIFSLKIGDYAIITLTPDVSV
jgi:hypothetical protein